MRPVCAALMAATLAAGCSAAHSAVGVERRNPAAHSQRTAQQRPIADALTKRQILLGYSVDRRPVVAEQLGDPDSPRRILVVGCIHGNEPAGIAVTRALAVTAAANEIDLWLVPDLNPDGVAAHTRGNAHLVDLNRNFPYRWRPIGQAGNTQYSGPHATSEPESRLMVTLLKQLRPSLGIWYHQHLNVVDDSQGPRALERRYAADTGMPLAALADYPGSAVGYQDHTFGRTAFVVELPAGQLSAAQAHRHALAVLDIARRVRADRH